MFISSYETIHEGPFYKPPYKKNVHDLTNSKRKGMLISSYEAIDYKKFWTCADDEKENNIFWVNFEFCPSLVGY